MAHNTKSLELHFKDSNDHDNAVIIDKYPDQCPVCEHGIEAKFIDAFGKTDIDRNGHYIQTIFQCPRLDCQTIFIAYYTSANFSPRNYSEFVFLRRCYIPTYFEEEKFDEEIEKLSPSFIKIFSQAKIADEVGLDLISGAGYRKALEFLLKDYLITIKPSDKDEVTVHTIGWLIANKICSEKIKISAGLAKDIGNDEVHYQRKIEELSLEDLKKLVRLTTHWISDEIITNQYKNRLEKSEDDKKTKDK